VNAEDILNAATDFSKRASTGVCEIDELRAYINNTALPSDIRAALESFKLRFRSGGGVVFECGLAECATLVYGENEARSTPRHLCTPWHVNGLFVELFPGLAPGRCEQEMWIKIYATGHGFASWVTHLIQPGAFRSSNWLTVIAKTEMTRK
jgi:hypothetical protein